MVEDSGTLVLDSSRSYRKYLEGQDILKYVLSYMIPVYRHLIVVRAIGSISTTPPIVRVVGPELPHQTSSINHPSCVGRYINVKYMYLHLRNIDRS